MFDLSNEPLDLACPKCGKKLKATFADVRPKKMIRCPGCGAEIKFKAGKPLVETLERMEKELDDTVSGLNTKLKLKL